MTGFTIPSFAKINWILRVIGRRDDGFHDLFTIFQTISLHDSLTFEAADAIELVCDVPGVPSDESNLIVRAARLMAAEFGIDAGARITLDKSIPAPGGLAGGSSNAATAMVGLARLWHIPFDADRFAELGSRLGSDVPFFFCGGTAAGTGRGTEIDPMADIEESLMLVVTPEIDVSTADAFRGLNANRLTKEESKSILKICRSAAKDFDSRRTDLKNDFEASVFAQYPEIMRVRDALLRHGARSALLSGSGASVFAVFDKEETRQATIKALETEVSWRKFAVSTVSRKSFREQLGF